MEINLNENKLVLPDRSIEIQIKQNTYTFNYPNTGEQIKIDTLKSSMSSGQFMTLPERTAAVVEMIATFLTMLPQLKKDMGLLNFSDLEQKDSNELLGVYINEIKPWLNKWEEILNYQLEKK